MPHPQAPQHPLLQLGGQIVQGLQAVHDRAKQSPERQLARRHFDDLHEQIGKLTRVGRGGRQGGMDPGRQLRQLPVLRNPGLVAGSLGFPEDLGRIGARLDDDGLPFSP